MPISITSRPRHILYQPINNFPTQKGPVCYFYSLVRAMQFQNHLYKEGIPAHCKKIVTEILKKHKETFYGVDTFDRQEELDDYIDEIFKANLTDSIIKDLNLIEGDEPIETVEDFIDNYPTSYAMGLLLHFKVIEKIDFLDLGIDGYGDLLRVHGPMTFDGSFGLNLEKLPPKYEITSWNRSICIYPVDEKLLCKTIQHTILMIGLQKSPEEQIYYIDPNFPDLILSISFATFKENVLGQGNRIVCQKKNSIQPIVDSLLFDKKFSKFDLQSSFYKENQFSSTLITGKRSREDIEDKVLSLNCKVLKGYKQ